MNFSQEIITETSQKMHPDHGEGIVKIWQMDGIYLQYSDFKFIHSGLFDAFLKPDLLCFLCNLKGKIIIETANYSDPIDLSGLQYTILDIKSEKVNLRNEELVSEIFCIQIDPRFFQEIFPDKPFSELTPAIPEKTREKQDSHPLFLFMDIYMQSAIREILRCPFTGAIKKTFWLSKALEILSRQVDAYSRYKNEAPRYVKTEYDRERILFARDYMIHNIEVPPSLSELAFKAGINEFKLKRGFKEIFNNTVFGYLAEYRLEQAKIEISLGQKSATEIAFELGYSSLQHCLSPLNSWTQILLITNVKLVGYEYKKEMDG